MPPPQRAIRSGDVVEEGLVAAAGVTPRRLDHDHLGPQVHAQPAGPGHRVVGQLDHPHPCQRPVRTGHVDLSLTDLIAHPIGRRTSRPTGTPQAPSRRTSSSCSPSPGARRRGPQGVPTKRSGDPGVGHLRPSSWSQRRREAPGHEVLVGQHLLGGVDDARSHAPLLQPDEQLVGGQRLRQVLDGGPAGAEDLGVSGSSARLSTAMYSMSSPSCSTPSSSKLVGQAQLARASRQRHELPPGAGRHAGVQPAPVGARHLRRAVGCRMACRPVWRCTVWPRSQPACRRRTRW